MIVYPEGTRNRGAEPLPLRYGMVRFAFRQGQPPGRTRPS